MVEQKSIKFVWSTNVLVDPKALTNSSLIDWLINNIDMDWDEKPFNQTILY